MPPSHWALFAGAEPAGQGQRVSLLISALVRLHLEQSVQSGFPSYKTLTNGQKFSRTEQDDEGDAAHDLGGELGELSLSSMGREAQFLFSTQQSLEQPDLSSKSCQYSTGEPPEVFSYLYSSLLSMVSPSLVLIRVSSLQRTILNNYSAFVPHFQARHKIPYIFEKYPTEGEE